MMVVNLATTLTVTVGVFSIDSQMPVMMTVNPDEELRVVLAV